MTRNGEKLALVAGGAGFIGSHLCDALLGEGARVVCVDSF
jgi:UDP-glucuronate decarboxylase